MAIDSQVYALRDAAVRADSAVIREIKNTLDNEAAWERIVEQTLPFYILSYTNLVGVTPKDFGSQLPPLLQLIKNITGNPPHSTIQECVELLATSTTCAVTDSNGNPPLIVALDIGSNMKYELAGRPAELENFKWVLRKLIEALLKKTDPNITNKDATSPVQTAIKVDDPMILYYLLTASGDVNAAKGRVKSAFLMSLIHRDFVEYEPERDIDNKRFTINSPIHCAVLYAFGAVITSEANDLLQMKGYNLVQGNRDYNPRAFKEFLTAQVTQNPDLDEATKVDITNRLENRFIQEHLVLPPTPQTFQFSARAA